MRITRITAFAETYCTRRQRVALPGHCFDTRVVVDSGVAARYIHSSLDLAISYGRTHGCLQLVRAADAVTTREIPHSPSRGGSMYYLTRLCGIQVPGSGWHRIC